MTGAVPLPDRVALRPGVEVVRRDDSHLQLGLGAHRVVLADTPELRRLLALLAAGRPRLPADGDVRRCADVLARSGLLVDADALWSDLGVRAELAATAYAEEPATAATRLRRRASARVALDASPVWAPELRRLLAAGGLEVVDGSDPAADVQVLASPGEPSRDRVDRLMRDGVPHLLLRLVEGRVSVGPFVVPGRTACLRCEDAHLTEHDPRWPLLVAQQPSPLTPRVTVEPGDPQLLALAFAWVARDVVSFVEGGEPATWSRTVHVDPGLRLVGQRWLRHPHCGCAWDLLTEVG
jgi:hypothetical protein